jgi:hypothetical protein
VVQGFNAERCCRHGNEPRSQDDIAAIRIVTGMLQPCRRWRTAQIDRLRILRFEAPCAPH